MIWPTNPLVHIAIGLGGVSYKNWIKWILPVHTCLFIVSGLFLLLAVSIIINQMKWLPPILFVNQIYFFMIIFLLFNWIEFCIFLQNKRENADENRRLYLVSRRY